MTSLKTSERFTLLPLLLSLQVASTSFAHCGFVVSLLQLLHCILIRNLWKIKKNKQKSTAQVNPFKFTLFELFLMVSLSNVSTDQEPQYYITINKYIHHKYIF